MSVPSLDLERLTKILRFGLVKILGESTLQILERFMLISLEEDMYHVLYEDPVRFYRALSKIYGKGADYLLKALFSTLTREGLLEPINASEIIIMIKSGDKNLVKSLLRSLSVREFHS
ncbi:MAG: hypothetical protein NZ929_06875 [Aigarchaeota archaeon]|nr:hypothetical protein [Aigarchaeota archaeon]MCX8192512.1 hypothetical protein [Nitrososphaeria archaeon]MDW7985752.1 hypothetical protein [Nitrososphaerota archaeon]